MLNVFLLGEQLITDDANGDVRLNSPKTLALLTLLVMHAGRPQTRQRVSSAWWPNSTDAQALTNRLVALLHSREGASATIPGLRHARREATYTQVPHAPPRLQPGLSVGNLRIHGFPTREVEDWGSAAGGAQEPPESLHSCERASSAVTSSS